MITFNGIDLSNFISVAKVTGRGPLAQDVTSLEIPGKPGAYIDECHKPPRELGVHFELVGNSLADIRQKVDELNVILNVQEAAPIVFGDEPTKTYFGILSGKPDWDEYIFIGKGSITFFCPDPEKVGLPKTASLQNSSSIFVEGTTETEPVIVCKIKQDTTYVAVSLNDGESMNMIGKPALASEAPYTPETGIFISECDSLVDWVNSTATSIEFSDQTGTLKTDGQYFYTDDYGSSPNWHGPAMKKSFSEAVQDFRFDVGLSQLITGGNQAGGIEVALLDANNQIVTKVTLTKHHGGLNTLFSKLRAGSAASGFDIIDESGYANFKNSFSGAFRMWRRGNGWTAQIFKMINGVFQTPITRTWTDINNIASAPVTQAQVRFLQRAGFPVLQQQVGEVYVFRLNDPDANQVKIQAKAGDTITFNHQDDLILLNEEPILKEKAFIGEYFSLKPGINKLEVEPAEAIENVEVRWRDKWL